MIFLFPLDVVVLVVLIVVEGVAVVVTDADVLNTAPLLSAAVIRQYVLCSMCHFNVYQMEIVKKFP